MKKNLISVLILAILVVNTVMTALLMLTILPQAKASNELITKIASAVELELESGQVVNTSTIPIENITVWSIEDTLTINLKDSDDGTAHYALVGITLSINTEDKDYETYYSTLDSNASLIQDQVISVISSHTYEEMRADQEGVQEEILIALQKMYDSDFIVGVNFSSVTYQ